MTRETLNLRQERFVLEYVRNGGNGTQAAIVAGYSAKTAEVQGSRLLSVAKVRAAIDAHLTEAAETAGATVEFVLRELLRLATADVSKAFDEDGQLLPIHKIPKDVRLAISGIDVAVDGRSGGTVKKVRFWSKDKSLEMLGRHLKMFTDKVEHSGTVELAEKLERARARAKT